MEYTYEMDTVIDRPVEEVFEYVTTPENDPEWIPSISSVSSIDGDMTKGTTWTRAVDLPFGTTEIVIECTDYESPTRFSYEARDALMGGRLRNAGVATFTQEGGATHFSFSPTIQLNGFLRFVRPLMIRMTKTETRTSLDNLKSVLETSNKQRPSHSSDTRSAIESE